MGNINYPWSTVPDHSIHFVSVSVYWGIYWGFFYESLSTKVMDFVDE